jgi:hypothetical protein
MRECLRVRRDIESFPAWKWERWTMSEAYTVERPWCASGPAPADESAACTFREVQRTQAASRSFDVAGSVRLLWSLLRWMRGQTNRTPGRARGKWIRGASINCVCD